MSNFKLSFLIVSMLLIGGTALSQQRAGAPQEKAYLNWTKEECHNHINALNKKAEYIKSRPDEYQAAKEAGWFKKAEEIKSELKARIEQLEK